MSDFAAPFSIRLTRRQTADLASLAVYDGLPRQELIRRALDAYIEDRRQKLLAQANARATSAPAPAPPVARPGPDAVTSRNEASSTAASQPDRPVKVVRR